MSDNLQESQLHWQPSQLKVIPEIKIAPIQRYGFRLSFAPFPGPCLNILFAALKRRSIHAALSGSTVSSKMKLSSSWQRAYHRKGPCLWQPWREWERNILVTFFFSYLGNLHHYKLFLLLYHMHKIMRIKCYFSIILKLLYYLLLFWILAFLFSV